MSSMGLETFTCISFSQAKAFIGFLETPQAFANKDVT